MGEWRGLGADTRWWVAGVQQRGGSGQATRMGSLQCVRMLSPPHLSILKELSPLRVPRLSLTVQGFSESVRNPLVVLTGAPEEEQEQDTKKSRGCEDRGAGMHVSAGEAGGQRDVRARAWWRV